MAQTVWKKTYWTFCKVNYTLEKNLILTSSEKKKKTKAKQILEKNWINLSASEKKSKKWVDFLIWIFLTMAI